ncbi:MAG: isoaspartyl peptidase/L-asparaginase [Candidatus Bathyarchaeota archaeon]|nr:isoaspartyl peptidase/L-asparaginase [Candidatus Bathyarchaeota archaeon]
MVKPFIIGTRNAREMLRIGVEILEDRGSAIDAIEATVNAVEENPEDWSVGLGGLPNLLGVTQLDASIMDGRTLRTGAVAAVEGYVHAISIARKVMEESPHVLLVGPGAELFAKAMGFERADLSTETSRRYYELFVNDAFGKIEDERRREYMVNYVKTHNLKEWYERLSEEHYGTVNVMAMDASGDVCSGVSTSGLALKFPGRVGDSPIIGAGNYCDNRVGAAACTGRGELAIRLSTARTIIGYMENGMSLRQACVRAMNDINALNETGGMNCLAFDRHGNTMSASTTWESFHCYMDVDSEEPKDRPGVWVKA